MMILFDPTFGANWEAAEGEINRLMQRAEAEVILVKPLEERRLHYEIKGRKRGLYVLVFFKTRGEKIGSLERDTRLSEQILRVLILSAEGKSREKMDNAVLGAAHDPRRRGGEPPHRSGPPPARRPPTPSEPAARPDAALVTSSTEEGRPADS